MGMPLMDVTSLVSLAITLIVGAGGVALLSRGLGLGTHRRLEWVSSVAEVDSFG